MNGPVSSAVAAEVVVLTALFVIAAIAVNVGAITHAVRLFN